MRNCVHVSTDRGEQTTFFLTGNPISLSINSPKRTNQKKKKGKNSKRGWLKGKATTNIDSILKTREFILPARVHKVKAMVFPASIMYRCESWTTKKAKNWRADTFKLWCQRRLLRVPWTTDSSNQSILKEIKPDYSLEGLMLKLQYFGYLMQRANSLEKTMTVGKIEGKKRGSGRGWNYQMASLT